MLLQAMLSMADSAFRELDAFREIHRNRSITERGCASSRNIPGVLDFSQSIASQLRLRTVDLLVSGMRLSVTIRAAHRAVRTAGPVPALPAPRRGAPGDGRSVRLCAGIRRSSPGRECSRSLAGLDALDGFEQFVVVGMVRQRHGMIDAQPVAQCARAWPNR